MTAPLRARTQDPRLETQDLDTLPTLSRRIIPCLDVTGGRVVKGVNFVALRDALLAVGIPFIEVHLSNVHAREPFRKQSYFSDLAVGVISGLGAQGYELALAAAIERLKK